ncbi:protoporphyrinogen oxidase [Candidatus Poribacteria bacterium]|nr:protoporphyrinogen oxidase [Candidatus Poribacteria bacterium]
MTERQNPNAKTAIVIGGGISGLTACYKLISKSRKRDLPLDIKLFEASSHLGGVIGTIKHNGVLMERGPDAFISTKPWARDLCQELGIAGQLVGTTDRYRRSFVVHDNSLHATPKGFYMMAPSMIIPLIRSPIFSLKGKLRMAMDLFLPPKDGNVDESLESFVVRRLGREVFERIAQPMIGGIYAADPSKLSLRATMPQFHDMEQHHESIIRALVYKKKNSDQQDAGGPRYSLFLSFQSGMQTLIEELSRRIPKDCIVTGAEVDRVSLQSKEKKWLIDFNHDQHIEADFVCVALPACHASGIIKSFSPKISELLSSVSYSSSITVNLVFRREQIGHPLDGMGFVVPSIEQKSILACSFSSVKFDNRTPENIVLLRAFVDLSKDSDIIGETEEQIIELVLHDLNALLDIRGYPVDALVSKYDNAIAQYYLGHIDRVAQIESEVANFSGLAFAGNAFHGVGIPDCINSAEKAVAKLFRDFDS